MALIHDLATGFKPNGQGDTDDKADDVDEGLVEDDDDGGAKAHDFFGSGISDMGYGMIVEGGRWKAGESSMVMGGAW